MTAKPNPELELAKSIVAWLVDLRLITPSEEKEINALNEKTFATN